MNTHTSLPQPTKKMRSIESFHNINGRVYRFRPYDFIREVVKRTEKKIDEIVRAAAKDGMREDGHSRYNHGGPSSSRTLVRFWNNTQQGYKNNNKPPSSNSYRVFQSKTKDYASGHGGGAYGITVTVTDLLWRNMSVIVHEMAHVAHLSAYYAPLIRGKRRPHDYTFNKVMLEMAHVLFGLTKKERNPFTWGYCVGKGYSSDKLWTTVFSKRIREGCPKVLRYLTDVTEERQAEIAAKEQREKEKKARQDADPVKRFTKAELDLIEIGRESCGDDYLESMNGSDIDALKEVDEEDIPHILREKSIDLSTMDNHRKAHLCKVLEELQERGFDEVEYFFESVLREDLPSSLRSNSRLCAARSRLEESISAIKRFAVKEPEPEPVLDGGEHGSMEIVSVEGQQVVVLRPVGETTAERDRNLLVMDGLVSKSGLKRGILLTKSKRYPVPCVIVQEEGF